MARGSLPLFLICLTAAACRVDSSDGGLGFSAGTTVGATDTGSSGSTDTDAETDTSDTSDTETGEPEEVEQLRYVASGSYDSVLLALNLNDAHDVPEPEYIATGTEIAGIFGPTPFGAEIVTHEGNIDQLRLTPEGVFNISPLAVQDGNWVHSVWFGDDGANALVSAGPEAYGAPNLLLWVTYKDDGEVMFSSDITPPLEPNGSLLVLARSPDSSYAAVLIDVELNDVWQLYLLPLHPQVSESIFIDHVSLEGVPATTVPAFLWTHLDDQRLIYRKELEPNVLSAVAVPLADPAAVGVNLAPSLGHVSSIVVSDDNTQVLLTTNGADGYRELRLVELTGPTSFNLPILITEPGELALTDLLLPNGPKTVGHGFDAQGRIWYAYSNSPQNPASVGIKIVTVQNGAVVDRREMTNNPPGSQLVDLAFDHDLQLLGYRSQTANQSEVHYIDFSAVLPAAIRVDQTFVYVDATPNDDASYGWSADRSRVAVTGIQDGLARLYVTTLGDPSGATVQIELPDVESAQGVTLAHQPSLSPNGDQVILWYGTQTGLTGLIHAPTDGSAAAQVILGLQQSLWSGTFMPRTPTAAP